MQTPTPMDIGIVAIYSYKPCDYSSWGLFEIEMTLEVGIVSKLANGSKAVTISVEGGDNLGTLLFDQSGSGIVKRIILHGGWYDRLYTINVAYEGSKTVLRSFPVVISPDRTLNFNTDGAKHYYKALRSMFLDPSSVLKGEWDHHISRYIGGGANRNKSGIHHLLYMYQISTTRRKYHIELMSIIVYFLGIVQPNLDIAALSGLVNHKYSSSNLCYDLVTELQYPIRMGYVSLDEMIVRLQECQRIMTNW